MKKSYIEQNSCNDWSRPKHQGHHIRSIMGDDIRGNSIRKQVCLMVGFISHRGRYLVLHNCTHIAKGKRK